MRLRRSRDADLPTQCGVPTANRAVSVALDTRQQSRGKQIHTHTPTSILTSKQMSKVEKMRTLTQNMVVASAAT